MKCLSPLHSAVNNEKLFPLSALKCSAQCAQRVHHLCFIFWTSGSISSDNTSTGEIYFMPYTTVCIISIFSTHLTRQHSRNQTIIEQLSHHSLCFLVPSSLMAKSMESEGENRSLTKKKRKPYFDSVQLTTLVFFLIKVCTVMWGGHAVTELHLSQ